MTKGHKLTANSAYVPLLPRPQLCFVLPLGGAPLSNVLGEAGDSPIIVLKYEREIRQRERETERE